THGLIAHVHGCFQAGKSAPRISSKLKRAVTLAPERLAPGGLIRQGFHSGRSDERLEDRLREIGAREMRAHDPGINWRHGRSIKESQGKSRCVLQCSG